MTQHSLHRNVLPLRTGTYHSKQVFAALHWGSSTTFANILGGADSSITVEEETVAPGGNMEIFAIAKIQG